MLRPPVQSSLVAALHRGSEGNLRNAGNMGGRLATPVESAFMASAIRRHLCRNLCASEALLRNALAEA